MRGFRGELGADVDTGKYRIVLQLGQGGTADVYLAVADGPSGFQKLVVLKILKHSLSSDPEFRTMFLSEARLAARLRHPNIVQTNEVLESGGSPIMVMEYLDGQPLSQVIVRGKQNGFTLAMQLRVLIDALGGLHAAHELTDFDGTPLGVVHRDVSPHNLFVTVEGQAKVLDFGIAKLERSIVQTDVGTIKGKLRYMAPEHIAGERLDRRADIYAAGVLLWEALVGERMWKGCPEHEIRSRVIAGDLPARPEAPLALDRICRRALSLRPEDRQATALELADEIEKALSELPSPAVSHREIGATVARLFEDVRAEAKAAIEQELSGMSAADASASTPAHAGARSRRRIVFGATGGAVAALLTVGAWAIWKGGIFSRGDASPNGNAALVVPVMPNLAPPAPPQPAELVRHVQPAPAPQTDEAALASQRAARDGKTGPSRPQRRLPPPAPSAATAPAPENPPGPPADCEHPFFVDAQGIKKYRPECM